MKINGTCMSPSMKETRFSLPFRGGSVTVVQRDGAVYQVGISKARPRGNAPRTGLAADMRRYLAGENVSFDRYEVDYSGYTEFQRLVLKAARKIPHGEVRSYGEVAEAVGRPRAYRAVGSTMANNRICIIVPCHRVVGANGVGGFTGSLDHKIVLLELEGIPKDRWLTGRYSRSKADKSPP
jgi:methylated-DNA-[protein]-cysteine S-methyltransferase